MASSEETEVLKALLSLEECKRDEAERAAEGCKEERRRSRAGKSMLRIGKGA